MTQLLESEMRNSLWAKYLKERQAIDSIEVVGAFINYSLLDDCLFINDLFVDESYRRTGIASELILQVEEIAISKGLMKIRTSVDPKLAGATESLKTALASRGKLLGIFDGQIILEKILNG